MLSDLCYSSQGGNSAWSSNETKPLRAYIQGHYKKRQHFVLWEVQQKGKKRKYVSKQASWVCLTVNRQLLYQPINETGFVFIFTAIFHFYLIFFKSKTFRKKINSLCMNATYFCYWGTCNLMSVSAGFNPFAVILLQKSLWILKTDNMVLHVY